MAGKIKDTNIDVLGKDIEKRISFKNEVCVGIENAAAATGFDMTRMTNAIFLEAFHKGNVLEINAPNRKAIEWVSESDDPMTNFLLFVEFCENKKASLGAKEEKSVKEKADKKEDSSKKVLDVDKDQIDIFEEPEVKTSKSEQAKIDAESAISDLSEI